MKAKYFVESKSTHSWQRWLQRCVSAFLLLPVCSCSVIQKKNGLPEYRFETVAGSDEGHRNGEATNALFRTPEGISVDSRGNLFITEYWSTIVRKISNDGTVSVLAGKDMETGNINGNNG